MIKIINLKNNPKLLSDINLNKFLGREELRDNNDVYEILKSKLTAEDKIKLLSTGKKIDGFSRSLSCICEADCIFRMH